MTLAGRRDGTARLAPVGRQVVVRIGELRTGLAGDRGLSAGLISVPCHRLDRIDLAAQAREGRIDKLVQVAPTEFVARQARARHALAWRHVSLRVVGGHGNRWGCSEWLSRSHMDCSRAPALELRGGNLRHPWNFDFSHWLTPCHATRASNREFISAAV